MLGVSKYTIYDVQCWEQHTNPVTDFYLSKSVQIGSGVLFNTYSKDKQS
jgi:hypothetical protein